MVILPALAILCWLACSVFVYRMFKWDMTRHSSDWPVWCRLIGLGLAACGPLVMLLMDLHVFVQKMVQQREKS